MSPWECDCVFFFDIILIWINFWPGWPDRPLCLFNFINFVCRTMRPLSTIHSYEIIDIARADSTNLRRWAPCN